MMRNLVFNALVLRNRPSKFASSKQEANSEVTLLTSEEGIIKATVFGGPKSKLRSHSAPYNSGKVWIYRNPEKEYGKLSDFDVRSWRPGLRELYERSMTAAGIAETILSSHGGGGDWGTGLELAIASLDALENANEEQCSLLLIHFLWRWADFLGLRPNLEYCAVCGAAFDGNPAWFLGGENILLCENCKRAGSLIINPGCCRWLSVTGTLSPSLLHRYTLDKKSFYEAKTLTTSVISSAIGKKLASWEW